MRLKALKNFSIGKIKDNNKKEKAEDEEAPAPEITEIKDTVEEKKSEPEPAAKKTRIPEGGAGIIVDDDDDITVQPHGPVAELTIDEEDLKKDPELTLDDEDSDEITLGDEVKLNEVTAEKATTPKEPAADAVTDSSHEKTEHGENEAKSEENEVKLEDGDSLNNLFSDEEEEENPLASLINSLPDVTVQELLDDIDEIKRIIKEWRTGVK